MDGQTQSMIPPFSAMLYFFGLKVDLQLVFFASIGDGGAASADAARIQGAAELR